MRGIFCTYAGKFDRGQMFRRYCVRCEHNKAHLGDTELRCRFLEFRPLNTDEKPTIKIPADLRE